ncbi:Di-copper centre-containing protein [Decorospora gaudefroyi]|uniref:tyrosinase n=1 Tax=Decorospora gaudefroyi TaxID=184978 RepID=A0A6A5KTX3_9PLEO|nr:Di-copper centre-containing protein [Decorospora gaudefroyi]
MANFSKPASVMTMLFAFLSVLQFSLAFQHGGNHHAHAVRSADAAIEAHMNEIAGELEKRQSRGRLAVTGVCSRGTASNGQCNSGSTSAPRLEIRQLKRNADQWNLYLLGMERFMAKDKGDTLSYYQVAGIHGRPFKTWNNFPTPLVNQMGFCPHGMTLFGSWHRPYLAIYEQAWYQAVQEVIATFPSHQQQRWRNAASTLRMPYWDWAQEPGNNQPTVPTLIRDQRVTVTKPTGTVNIPNPLYSYSFGSSLPSEMGGGPWNNFPSSLRRPVANPTRSNNNEMNARFNSMRISLRDRVFALFSSKSSWGDASTEAIGVRTDLSGSGVDSFESVHDAIHNTAGGETGGHMYYLDVAAFDPIFWLHHTNVDRLLAMYQHIVPNTYVSNGNVVRPMAQWNQGEPKNAYTPLKPFTKDSAGNYFTSVDVRETRTLGYYYPETSDRTYSQVARAVTNLYGAGVRSLNKRATDENTGQYLGRPFKEGDYHTVVDIIADKFALEGSYTVHCFIGKPGSNSTSNSTAPYPVSNSTAPYNNGTEADYDPSTDFTQDPNYVGGYGILGAMMQGGGNASEAVITKGALPLTTCLQGKEAAGELESLAPEHVTPYLKKNFYYKVVGVNGELNADDVPNLHISVKCNKVKPAASDDELPDLSAPYTVLPEVTEHLPAGKPFTYVPSAIDVALPEGPEYEEPNPDGSMPESPSSGVFPYPGMPWQEEGYCVSKQTIEYVDTDGNFLYSEM